MENIENHLKQSFNCRSIEILNNIAATNPQYRQLTKQITKLGKQLTKELPERAWQLLDRYRDRFLQREALIVDLLYRQGFKDGADFRTLLQNLATE